MSMEKPKPHKTCNKTSKFGKHNLLKHMQNPPNLDVNPRNRTQSNLKTPKTAFEKLSKNGGMT